MVTAYYGERIQIEINKGKRRMRWSPGETKHKLPSVPSQGSHMETCLILSTTNVATDLKCWQPGKSTWSLVSRVFTGVQSCMYTEPVWLTSITQIPALPPTKQKQAFTINQIIRMNLSCQTGRVWPKASGIQRHSYQGKYFKGFVFQPLFLRDSTASI